MTAEEKKLQNPELEDAAAAIAPLAKGATQTGGVGISDESYNKALEALNGVQKPTYAGTYDTQLNDIYQQIVNRPSFNYDVNADAMYNQYKDQYINLGQMAMKDTMGQAAALTGGYGSSYGQSVGQQAYDSYLKQLNNAIPELYGMALDRYNAEGDRLADLYAKTGALAQDEYNKYQDAYDRYWQERDYNYSNLTALITSTGYMPTEDELAAAGMTKAQADELRLKWAAADPDKAMRGGKLTADEYRYLTGMTYGASSGGGGGYYGGPVYGKIDPAVQQELKDMGYYTGEVDGLDGPLTQKALADYQAANTTKVEYFPGGLGKYMQ